jgi:hypothetical protein
MYSTEEQTQELSTNIDILGDIAKCNRALKWEQDEEYGDEYRDMEFEIEQNRLTIVSRQDEIICMDRMRYNEAKKIWEERHKEFVEAKKLEKNHEFHTDYKEGCPICVRRKELREVQQTYEAEQERLREEQEAKLKIVRETAIRESRQIVEQEVFNCKQCNYMTTDKTKYNIHMGSREHVSFNKLKALYCEPCKTQCRNEGEYDSHCLSTKHKKHFGEIKVEEKAHECNLCNYTTPYKQVYETHLRSKKHNENVNKV